MTDEQVEDALVARMMYAEMREDMLARKVKDLLVKAKALVDMLDDAERNHGGLYAGKTMRSANELRLELQRWK